VPPASIRELRDLTRHRKSLIQERTRAANRLHKVLEDAGVTSASVATDILGVSGRAMLEALVQGTTDAESWPTWLAGRCARNFPPCGRPWVAASGSITAFLSPRSWRTSTALDEGIDTVSAQIEVAIAPFTEEVERLDTIPGVNRRTAEVIIAEIGVDMRVFPTAGHLASWAGLCPGNNESAGKHRPARTRKGDRWLRAALTEAAMAAGPTRPRGPSPPATAESCDAAASRRP
jgi:transposase